MAFTKDFVIALGTYRVHSLDSNDHSSLEVAVSLAAIRSRADSSCVA